MIDQPMFFDEAINYVLDKTSIGDTAWDSKRWNTEGRDIKDRAFLISSVENARFLDRAHALLFDYLAKVRDDVTTPKGEKTSALRIGSRADFVRLMREFMISEGMATPEQIEEANQTDVKDIKGEARLRLIFDTNIRQAYAYGNWKQGMQPEVLAEFPAAKLVRDRDVSAPRPRHTENLGQVRLKDDPWWSDFINAEDIGGFQVPWGPYGFGSGCEQTDATMAEYLKQNPPKPGEEPPTAEEEAKKEEDKPEAEKPQLNDGFSSSTLKLNPEVKARLLEELRAKGADRAKIVEKNDRLDLERRQQGKTIFDQ